MKLFLRHTVVSQLLFHDVQTENLIWAVSGNENINMAHQASVGRRLGVRLFSQQAVSTTTSYVV